MSHRTQVSLGTLFRNFEYGAITLYGRLSSPFFCHYGYMLRIYSS